MHVCLRILPDICEENLIGYRKFYPDFINSLTANRSHPISLKKWIVKPQGTVQITGSNRDHRVRSPTVMRFRVLR